MATRHQFTQTKFQRQHRYFSTEFKKKKIRELEQNLTSVAEIVKEYEVSRSSVYEWIYKFSTMRKRTVKQVVEPLSDTRKMQALKDQIKYLERSLGQKQLLIDFQAKVIELAEEEYKVDIKKKFGDSPYSGTGTIGKVTE